jgi:PAS domain S-box-containing protein
VDKSAPKGKSAFAAMLDGTGPGFPAPVRYSTAVGFVGAALAARFIILPVNGGLAFNTFYPAVIAAAMLLGVGPGLLASGLSAICAVYFFLAPLESMGHTSGYLASLGFFLVTCALTCFLAFRMRRSVSALRASEHKLRSLFEASSVGIVLTDADSRFIDFNEAYRGFTGYPADELRTLSDWTLTDKNESTGTEDLAAMAKRTGHFGPLEKDYVRKNRSRIPLRFNGALFTGDDGKQYLWSIVEDISDQRSLQRAVLESTSAEQQKLGHDLHDGLSQELTGIAMLAAEIATRLQRDGRHGARQSRDARSGRETSGRQLPRDRTRPFAGDVRRRRPGRGAQGDGGAQPRLLWHFGALRSDRHGADSSRARCARQSLSGFTGGGHQRAAARRCEVHYRHARYSADESSPRHSRRRIRHLEARDRAGRDGTQDHEISGGEYGRAAMDRAGCARRYARVRRLSSAARAPRRSARAAIAQLRLILQRL